MALARLYYIHDPMCSWCWAFAPTWAALRAALPEGVSSERLLGGLAPDSTTPMPPQQRQQIQQTWRHIEHNLGTPFNHGFWTECTPVRSTYPACRAVIAARFWDAEDAMIRAIQEAYYLNAQNPAEPSTLVSCAHALGLPVEAFAERLYSEQTEIRLQEEIQRCVEWGVRGFPSLVLTFRDKRYNLTVDYNHPQHMADEIYTLLGMH
ncbi:DsbA family protein [Pokkaliibacter plantistimulans]|uniref:DsbA family protein n=1 Tax=Proteobacteria bacterium 228 TaxID=2083153 RepID=A0A2S5KM48_9PROT|nr:DsbA family protein [Pokkaliibacter plantistimulans]PPC75904.1 DsbA family protein [Pokkaliibacter plantistimulans]